jgi:hypothetical protein
MIPENELIRLLLLLADTQHWLDELSRQTVLQLQTPASKNWFAKKTRLPVTVLAHIVERHYYKTLRHPGTGKFTISLPAILDLMKEAAAQDAMPMPGSVNYCRSLVLPYQIGINKIGEPAYTIVLISDGQGNIVTAFPE